MAMMGTTICAVKRGNQIAVAGDGQVTMGEVISPDDGVAAIGSGGKFALAAARALVKNTDMSAEDIAVEALNVAASICVYTNDHITVETL